MYGRQKFYERDLLKSQLETLKLFLERNILTQEQYDYEVKVLTTKIEKDK